MSLPHSPSVESPGETERLRRALEEATDRIRSLEALRDDLVGLLSHDFRAPFAVIRGLADILRDEPDRDPAETADFLDRIIANADQGIRLAANVVEAVRGQGRRPQPCREAVDVATLIDDVIDRFEPLARVRQVSLVRRADPALAPVQLDPEMMDRVLTNLLAGTIDAAPRGGRVTLSADRTDGGIVLAVRGDGLSLSDAESRRFLRESPSEGRAETPPVRSANDLALHVVKRLIEAHGGAVSLEPAAGGGSVFTLHL